jgi:hypothetical protein
VSENLKKKIKAVAAPKVRTSLKVKQSYQIPPKIMKNAKKMSIGSFVKSAQSIKSSEKAIKEDELFLNRMNALKKEVDLRATIIENREAIRFKKKS